MSQRKRGPFRAEHVGSLIRPPDLVAARAKFESGLLPQADLAAIEDQAVRDVVRLQQEVGLPVATDGEFRRHTWHIDFFEKIRGVERRAETLTSNFRTKAGPVPSERTDLYVTGTLRLGETIFGDHFRFLKAATGAITPKIAIPSPSLLHRRGGRAVLEGDVYRDLDGFWSDLITVYREEIRGLAAIGCAYVQIDDTSFAALCDPAQRATMTKSGNDGERLHLTYIRLINEALKGRPADMTVCMHTCRGNYRGAWLSEGGYDFLAEAMFNELDIDGFMLEYDDERSGGFEPLRYVPKDKMIVLGLVTTKSGTIESKDALKRRIDDAARYVPLDQLCLSPQCGFSCAVEGNALSVEAEVAKLRLVVETAREVWG